MSRYLHFTNNTIIPSRGEPGYDRLAKFGQQFKCFVSHFSPAMTQIAKTALMRLSTLKQYMPKKPIKRGFKVWVRADSHNGYISDLDVYTGKEESMETSLGAKVVKKLSRALVGGSFHLYFEKIFSSVSPLRRLVGRRHMSAEHSTKTGRGSLGLSRTPNLV